jgi:hypothetical protein
MQFSYRISIKECCLVLQFSECSLSRIYVSLQLLNMLTLQMSRPQYNQLFVKKPDLDDAWP